MNIEISLECMVNRASVSHYTSVRHLAEKTIRTQVHTDRKGFISLPVSAVDAWSPRLRVRLQAQKPHPGLTHHS